MESKCLQVHCPECNAEVKLQNLPVQRIICEGCNTTLRAIIRRTGIPQKGGLTAEVFHFGKGKIVEGKPEIEIVPIPPVGVV